MGLPIVQIFYVYSRGLQTVENKKIEICKSTKFMIKLSIKGKKFSSLYSRKIQYYDLGIKSWLDIVFYKLKKNISLNVTLIHCLKSVEMYDCMVTTHKCHSTLWSFQCALGKKFMPFMLLSLLFITVFCFFMYEESCVLPPIIF